jgi:putative AlgH/UPF0301 family transcriptional regulator
MLLLSQLHVTHDDVVINHETDSSMVHNAFVLMMVARPSSSSSSFHHTEHCCIAYLLLHHAAPTLGNVINKGTRTLVLRANIRIR